jgi:hypothetical protein
MANAPTLWFGKEGGDPLSVGQISGARHIGWKGQAMYEIHNYILPLRPLHPADSAAGRSDNTNPIGITADSDKNRCEAEQCRDKRAKVE